MSTRSQMIKALQEVVVPHIREHGFKGSFPHFRRHSSDHIDIITFQFDRHGGGFVIELGQCKLDEHGVIDSSMSVTQDKVTAWDLSPNQRARIQSRSGCGAGDWFRYDSATSTEEFLRTAQSVLPFLNLAESLLDQMPFKQKYGNHAYALNNPLQSLRNSVHRLLRRK